MMPGFNAAPFASGWISCAGDTLSLGNTTTAGIPAAAQYAETDAEVSPVEAQIEFIRAFDIVEATGVDRSEGGICFDVPDTLCFDMKGIRAVLENTKSD